MKITKEKVYFHAPYRTLLSDLGRIGEKGINCEIYVDGKALDAYTGAEIERINSTFEKYGILKIVHGPFLGLNPGSRDPKIQELTLQRFTAAFEFCRKIKAGRIVLHSGFEPIFYKDASNLFLRLSIPIWKEALKAAAKDNIEIVIGLLKELDSPYLEACFDAGHYNVFGQKGIWEALEEYPPDSIGELHLSDNKGDFDSHLALGEGNIDYKRFFREIEKKGKEPILTSEPHSMADIEKNLKYLISLSA
jgi:sugar phosphate isomerase/epimerase